MRVFLEKISNCGDSMIGRKMIFALAGVAGSLMATPGYNMPRGVTPMSHKIYDLHMMMFYVCVVVGIAVFSVMFYVLLKHRKSLGVTPSNDHGNNVIEILWTVIPLIILLLLAYPAGKLLLEMDKHQEADVNILVTGQQWKWKYQYIDHGITFFSNLSTPNEQIIGKEPKGEHYLLEVDKPLVVPIHTNIRFLFTSSDVNHSWWVPELGIKTDTIPGYINEAWTVIEKPGTYRGQCTELCGMHHGFMPVVVIAKTEKEYAKWVREQTASLEEVKPLREFTMDESMKLGKQVYTVHCQACHQENGMGMPPMIPAMVGGMITTGSVASHIDILLNGVSGTSMQSFSDQLSDEEIAAVITYERNAWGNNDKAKYGDRAGGLIQPKLVYQARTGESAPEPGQKMAKNAREEAKPPKVWDLEHAMDMGKKVYSVNCQACHQANGMGMPPMIPAMVGGKITTGPISGHIDILLHGVKGTAMNSFAALTDEEIAAVVTYERNDWGNSDKEKYGQDAGGLVTPDEVKRQRSEEGK